MTKDYTPTERQKAMRRAVQLQELWIRTPHIRTDESNAEDDRILAVLRQLEAEAK